MHRIAHVAMVLATLWVSGACRDSLPLQGQDARGVIERIWNQPDVGLLIGTVRFVAAGAPVATSGHDVITEWPLYEACASNGLLRISDVKDLSRQFGSWDDWLKLTQNGIRKIATVEATEQGRARGRLQRTGESERLLVKVATTKVEMIAADDERKVGIDRYRVVLGTHTYDIPEAFSKAFAEARGWNGVRERRFKALLKYDPIDRDWRMVTADISPRAQDFATNSVGQQLKQLEIGVQ